MKLFLSLFLLLAISTFGASPDYKAFRGSGGITIVSNPPNGTIVIDGTTISDPVPFDPIYVLDHNPGALAAWSMLKLTTNAVPKVVTLRRPDGATNIFGFNHNDIVDTNAIFAWSGGTDIFAPTNSFVTQWYDQTTNAYVAIQDTNSIQPFFKIARNGVAGLYSRGNVAESGKEVRLPAGLSVNKTNVSVYMIFRADEKTYTGYTAEQNLAFPHFGFGGSYPNGLTTRFFNTVAGTYTCQLRIFGASEFRETTGNIRFADLRYTLITFRSSATQLKTSWGRDQYVKTNLPFSGNSIYTGGSLMANNDSGYLTAGELVAFIVYPAHSDATQAVIQNDLCNAFQISTQQINQVFFDGDSITGGYQVEEGGYGMPAGIDDREQSYPFEVSRAIGRTDVHYLNLGVSSMTSTQLVNYATGRVDSLYLPGFTNVIVFAAGINDLALGGTSNTVWMQATQYAAARRLAASSAGTSVKLLIMDLIPAAITVAQDIQRTNYNLIVSNNWATWFDAYAPVSTNLWYPVGSTNYQDGTHPNAAGRALYAGTLTNIVSGLLTDGYSDRSTLGSSSPMYTIPPNSSDPRVAFYQNGDMWLMGGGIIQDFKFTAPSAPARQGVVYWNDGTNVCVVLRNGAGTLTTNKLSMTAWP